MRMPLIYEITGYDRKTGRLASSHEIRGRRIANVRMIAGISSADDGLGSYPLTAEHVARISEMLGIVIDQTGCDFFLEPHTEARQEPKRAASR